MVEFTKLGFNNRPPELSTNMKNVGANIVTNDWQLKPINEEMHTKYIASLDKLR